MKLRYLNPRADETEVVNRAVSDSPLENGRIYILRKDIGEFLRKQPHWMEVTDEDDTTDN